MLLMKSSKLYKSTLVPWPCCMDALEFVERVESDLSRPGVRAAMPKVTVLVLDVLDSQLSSLLDAVSTDSGQMLQIHSGQQHPLLPYASYCKLK